MGLHALGLLLQQRLIAEIALLQSATRMVVLPPPCPISVSPADFSASADLMERAYRDSAAFLDEAPAGRSIVPTVMRRMHEHQ